MKLILTGACVGILLSSGLAVHASSLASHSKKIPENGILAQTQCVITNNKEASASLKQECDGGIVEVIGTGTRISDEDVKKMENMSAIDRFNYLESKYPSPLPAGLGKLEESGFAESRKDDIGMSGSIQGSKNKMIKNKNTLKIIKNTGSKNNQTKVKKIKNVFGPKN